MDGGERAVVTGVHRLQHIQRLRATTLADDNSVRPHPQRVDDQILNRHAPLAFDVRRTRFEANQVAMREPQFRRVLDGDDAFAFRDELADDIQQRGLAGTRAAGDNNVLLGAHGFFQKFSHRRGQTAVADQVFHGQLALGKFTDGQRWPVERDGRNDGVDAAAVGQTRIHARRRFVHATSERLDDAADDRHQMFVVVKPRAGFLEPALLHKNAARAVDHDFGHGRVFQHRRDGAVGDEFIQHGRAQQIQREVLRNFVAHIAQHAIQRLLHLRQHLVILQLLGGDFAEV